MRRYLIITAFIIVTTGSASAFTWPEAFPYDGLLSNESVDFMGMPNAWHIRGGVNYAGILNGSFDSNGDRIDDYSNTSPTDVAYGNYYLSTPFTLGYNVMGVVQLDVTLQVLRFAEMFPSSPSGIPVDYDETGLGDIWIKARGIFDEGDGWYFCPRGAVKFFTSHGKSYISDKQVDCDIAAQIGKVSGESWFRGTGSLGFRYRLSKELNTVGFSNKVKPGAMMYLTLDPGIAITPRFEIYLPVNALYYMDEVIDGDSKEDTGGRGLAIGVKPRYIFNDNIAVDGHFIIPILGKNVNNEMLFGVNFEAYSPL